MARDLASGPQLYVLNRAGKVQLRQEPGKPVNPDEAHEAIQAGMQAVAEQAEVGKGESLKGEGGLLEQRAQTHAPSS